MIGLPELAQVDALAAALKGAGWPDQSVRKFSPRESTAEFQAMVDHAGPLAGFGDEITFVRRYLALTQQGYGWLLVQADDSERAAAAAEMARSFGATQAVYDRTLTEEELIP
jgi:hypothetical protein